MGKPKYQNRYLKQTFKLKATLNGKKNRKTEKIQTQKLTNIQTVNHNDDTSLDDLETVGRL